MTGSAPSRADARASTMSPSLGRLVHAFPSAVLRLYCRIRFLIIGPRFLDQIASQLPESGEVLDIGCGFGLAALYLTAARPGLVIHGYDLNAGRIATATQAAAVLGQTNVRFAVGDAARLTVSRGFDAAYVIDLIHHVPREFVPGFLSAIHDRLRPGGSFIIKDVDDRPFYKRWFSLLTDRVMCGFQEPIYYWPMAELRAALETAGFRVTARSLPDWLPYPHVFYVCERPLNGDAAP